MRCSHVSYCRPGGCAISRPLRFVFGCASLPLMLHHRLLNEATHLGAEEVLRRLPAELRPTLEQPVHQAIREAVFHYAEGMETLSRQIHPLQHDRSRA